jgi:predicted RNA-binding Zn-ribbon protein involved in translation (DUF1610 family)
MATFTGTIVGVFQVEQCIYCFSHFGMNGEHYKRRQGDRQQFWCPSCGRDMVYTGETPIQRETRLRQEAESRLAAERARHDQTRDAKSAVERSLKATKGVITRVKNRVSKGVCPCCNRYFVNLHRHMSNQHPDYENAEG